MPPRFKLITPLSTAAYRCVPLNSVPFDTEHHHEPRGVRGRSCTTRLCQPNQSVMNRKMPLAGSFNIEVLSDTHGQTAKRDATVFHQACFKRCVSWPICDSWPISVSTSFLCISLWRSGKLCGELNLSAGTDWVSGVKYAGLAARGGLGTRKSLRSMPERRRIQSPTSLYKRCRIA